MTAQTQHEMDTLLKEAAHRRNAAYADYESLKRRIPADRLTPDEYTRIVRTLCDILGL